MRNIHIFGKILRVCIPILVPLYCWLESTLQIGQLPISLQPNLKPPLFLEETAHRSTPTGQKITCYFLGVLGPLQFLADKRLDKTCKVKPSQYMYANSIVSSMLDKNVYYTNLEYIIYNGSYMYTHNIKYVYKYTYIT